MSLGGLLSLKWNNHCSTFLHILSTLHRKQSYDDATVACDGKLYPVHKLVLSTCSEYFEEMFEKTQGKHPVIVLKDIKKEVFEALLKYMYIGEVNVVQEKLAELINAAECLKIKGLAVPDEEPEPHSHSTANKNKSSTHASSSSNHSLADKESTHQSCGRSARASTTNSLSTKRKENQSFHSSNAPPRKILRGSNETLRSAAPAESSAKDDGTESLSFASTLELPRSGETRENRSSLDERTSTSSSLTNNEENDVTVWPSAVKEEPVDSAPDDVNASSGGVSELVDDVLLGASQNITNNSDADGGGGSGHNEVDAAEQDTNDEVHGEDGGTELTSSAPQSEEKNEESSAEPNNDQQEVMTSKVEVEESSDDWEGVLIEKGDGDDAEALNSMLSGDDASNTAGDDKTSGGNVASDDDCVILSAKEESSDRLLPHLRSPSPPQPFAESAPHKGDDTAVSSALEAFGTPFYKGSPRDPPSFDPTAFGNSSENSASMDELGVLWSTGPSLNANFPARASLVSSLTSAFDSDQFLKMSRSSSRASSDSEPAGAMERMLLPQVLSSAEASTSSTSRESCSNYTKLPSGLYRCNVCNYEAMYASAVKIHLRSHSGEKPYKCPLCPYKSTTSGNVKTHLRKHTGETPFVCNLCNFRAKHKITLKTHMVNVHQITINRYSSYASHPPVQTMGSAADLGPNSLDAASLPQNLGLVSPSQQDLRLAFDSSAFLRHQQQQLQQSLAQKDFSSAAGKNINPIFLQQQQHQRRDGHSKPGGGERPLGESTSLAEEDTTDQIEKTLQAFGTLISTVTEAAQHSAPAAPDALTTFASTSVSVSLPAQPDVPSGPDDDERSDQHS